MGLGFQISADLRNTAGMLEMIDAAIRSVLTEPLDRLLLQAEEEGGVLYVQLHPAEEPVEFILDGGSIVASAKTSSAGPGYHAWVVDLVEEIGRRVDIPWNWTDQGNGEGDSTGFHESFDFTRLQTAMADSLPSMAHAVLKTNENQDVPIALSLPLDDVVLADAFAVSSIGTWTRDWFESLIGADEAARLQAAARFFPAWHPRDDARYWRGCGLALCWYPMRWVQPVDLSEETLYKAALGCFARAREMDPAIKLPEDEIREIWTLLSREGEDRPPSPNGIGFRRGAMLRQLPGGWTTMIPGYFAADYRDDGATRVFSFGDRSVQGTAMRAPDDGGDGEAGRRYVQAQAEQSAGDPNAFSFENGHVLGWGSASTSGAPNSLGGMLATGLDVLSLTITCEDSEDGRAWADSVLRSATRPPADPDSG